MRKILICFIIMFLFVSCKNGDNMPPNPYDPVNPWGITYDGENLWVTDDSLNMIYKLDLELDLKDSFALSKGYIRGIAAHDDGLWIVSDSAVGDSAGYPIFNIYKIGKLNGTIIDSIRIKLTFTNPIEYNFLWGITGFNSNLYVSYNGGWGPCMFEINPQSGEIRTLCCPHPCGFTVINDTLWSVRMNSVEGPGNSLLPISVSASGASEIRSLRYELEFYASDLAFDGDDVWVVDRDSSIIRKITDLR